MSNPQEPPIPASFNQQIYTLVRHIPSGRVLSYGRVAALLGVPHGARAVGWAMAAVGSSPASRDVPWWRVVNSAGRISIRSSHYPDAPAEQRERLQAEGVRFTEDDPLKVVEFNAILWLPASLEVQAILDSAT